MCARYEISAPPQDLAELFALAAPPTELKPRWNAAPTQLLPVVRAADDGARRLDLLRWGLVPSWADDVKIGVRMINARAETAGEKPSFRVALRKRRCLVPVTGFYEWTGEKGAKQAWSFRRADRRAFAFAGLWESWRGEGVEAPVETFTILTTAANELVVPVHDRMPVIVDPEHFALWLDPRMTDPARLRSLLAPSPQPSMVRVAVGTAVNDPRRDDPVCAEPLAARDGE